MLHGKVRPDDRGLLPQRDRGGQFAVRARNTRHRGHGAVRVDARPVHQERAGVRRRVLADEPPDVPGHQADEGADHARQGQGPRADPARGQQGGPGAPARGARRRGRSPGAGLGLPVRRGVGQEPHQRQRDVRRDRARDERQPRQGEEDVLLLYAAVAAPVSTIYRVHII